MTPDASTKQTETSEKEVTTSNNPAQVKKAVALGKDLMNKKDATKADVPRRMHELIQEEPREVIVQAFIAGASLTPKGAQTYFYNCKRKIKKGS